MQCPCPSESYTQFWDSPLPLRIIIFFYYRKSTFAQANNISWFLQDLNLQPTTAFLVRALAHKMNNCEVESGWQYLKTSVGVSLS